MGGGNLRSSSARSISTRCFWNNVPLLSSFEAFASFLSDFDLSDTKEKKLFIIEFFHRYTALNLQTLLDEKSQV